jgi:hypothetical protein
MAERAKRHRIIGQTIYDLRKRVVTLKPLDRSRPRRLHQSTIASPGVGSQYFLAVK